MRGETNRQTKTKKQPGVLHLTTHREEDATFNTAKFSETLLAT